MIKSSRKRNLPLFMLGISMVLSLTACNTSGKASDNASKAASENAAGTASSENDRNTEAEEIYLTLVNKTHELPENWEEKVELITTENAFGEDIQIEKGAYEAFLELREALLDEDVDIELDSCYRSVAEQEDLWDRFEKEYGLDYCKEYVATPGYSEHHTGLAVDVCLKKDGELIEENDDMMKETEIWEKVHAKLAEYGFILRYLDGKEDITGYSYEPWHLRYVGDAEIAHEIADQGITLEEYLGQME